MSTENENNESQPSELSLLKQRADLMGIAYPNNITAAKLKKKIAEKTEPPSDNAEYAEEELETIDAAQEANAADTFTPLKKQTPVQLKNQRRKEALRLVRIRISNMNPINNNMKGVMASVGNSELGMVKKFVPFNAEDGWHVPAIVVQYLRDKKYSAHYEVKVNGKPIKKTKLVPEFAVEILPPLTPKELEALRQRQIIARSADK